MPQALFARSPGLYRGPSRLQRKPQPPMMTVSRGSSDSILVYKPLAPPYTSDVLRHSHTLSRSGSELTSSTSWESHYPSCQISFFFSMAQTPTHSKCPPWLTSAVPALSINRGSLTQDQGHPPPHRQHTKKLALGGAPACLPRPSPWHCWTPRRPRPPPEEAGSPASWFHSFPSFNTSQNNLITWPHAGSFEK